MPWVTAVDMRKLPVPLGSATEALESTLPGGIREAPRAVPPALYEERPRVTREVTVAAAHGDRSENYEYSWQEKLREIDAKIHRLQKQLESTRWWIPPRAPDDTGFSATVTVQDEAVRRRRTRSWA